MANAVRLACRADQQLGRQPPWALCDYGSARAARPRPFSSASSGVLALGPLLASPRCWRPAGRAWGKSPLSWGPLVRAQLYLFSFLAFSPERPWRGGGAVSLASVRLAKPLSVVYASATAEIYSLFLQDALPIRSHRPSARR